jgi:hypothetical protein
VFFDTLGLEWWYEPEGFTLQFDYEKLVADWRHASNMTEDELLQEGVVQTFQYLDGKEYTYLPDFYLPDLNNWVEIKGPEPTIEEIEKTFLLHSLVSEVASAKLDEAKTAGEQRRAFDDLLDKGVYIIYGDIPWPFPQKGNIFGYGTLNEGYSWVNVLTGEYKRTVTWYRSLLLGQLQLCWQECPLCLKIGVGEIGAPYCRTCYHEVLMNTWDHVVEYQVIRDAAKRYGVQPEMMSIRPPNPVSLKAVELAKGLLNPEFFTSGHKSPKLKEAYSAARSARFEHGESP